MNVMEWTTEVGCAYTASFTIGAVGATMTCTIQLKDFAGNNLTVKNAITIFTTSDAAGNTQDAVTSIVLATHGQIISIEATKAYLLITEDDGKAAITVDNDGATDIYINVILPNGKVVTSGVMAFNA